MKLSEFKIIRKVELHETDLGGLVHHHNYFLWMEQAEYEMFDFIEEPVIGDLDDDLRGSGWPRAEVSMKYIKPLHYGEKVEIHLKIRRIRAAAVEYETDFYRLFDDCSELVASGTHKTICCMYDALGRKDPVIVPAGESFLSKICVYQQK